MHNTNILRQNLRFLLWKDFREQRGEWVARLAGWLACDRARANEILNGGAITHDEQSRLCDLLGIEPEDLQSSNLVATNNVDILKENVQYLLNNLGHGEALKLADAVQVTQPTISEWRNWKRRKCIGKDHQHRLVQYFSLPQQTDMETEPLFLSTEPIGEKNKRGVLVKWINGMKAGDLERLFPALQKLLEN